MKRKLFFGALLLEAALCLLLALTQTVASDTSLFVFPFAHLGSVLRLCFLVSGGSKPPPYNESSYVFVKDIA